MSPFSEQPLRQGIESTLRVPDLQPVEYLELGREVPAPANGHILKVTAQPRVDHLTIDLYPYADSDLAFDGCPDGTFIARMNRTVEAGILIGSVASLGNDPERWIIHALSNGREMLSCRPPLIEIAATVNLTRTAGHGILICAGVISADPTKFEDSLQALTGQLGFTDTADQTAIIYSAQDQVAGFWNGRSTGNPPIEQGSSDQ